VLADFSRRSVYLPVLPLPLEGPTTAITKDPGAYFLGHRSARVPELRRPDPLFASCSFSARSVHLLRDLALHLALLSGWDTAIHHHVARLDPEVHCVRAVAREQLQVAHHVLFGKLLAILRAQVCE